MPNGPRQSRSIHPFMNGMLLCAVLGISLRAGSAHGQTQGAAVAATLFEQAVAKMEADDYAGACPLLEQSYKLDARLGTLFTLADCRDQEGKSSTAQVRYQEYVRAVSLLSQAERLRHAERVKVAEKRVRELGPEIPTLKLVWPGQPPAGLVVRVDEIELALVTLNLPLPFDPGTHQLIIKRPGTADEMRTITLEKGGSQVVDIATPIAPVKPQEGPVKPQEGPVKSADTPKTQPKPTMHIRKTVGFVALGAGGLGLVAGGILGSLAISAKQTVKEHCTGADGLRCDGVGFAAVDDLRTYANASTLGFVVGGVLAGAGVVLVLTAPASTAPKVNVRATGLSGFGFLTIEGAF